MPLWREAHFEVKMLKHIILRALLEVEMSKKCTLLWHKATLEVNMQKKTKTPHVRTLLDVQTSVLYWSCKAMAGVGRFQRVGKDACRVAGAMTRDA